MRKFSRFSLKSTSYLIVFIVTNFLGFSDAFAECQSQACIEVYVKDGKLVIDGRKDGSTTKSTPRPTPKISFKPSPKPLPKLTSGSISTKPKSSPPRKTYKPTSSPKVTTPSMADRILQSLPTLQVAYQPEGTALIRVPEIGRAHV